MYPVEIDFGILPAVRKFAIPLRRTFETLVIVGLGGSSLGTKALLQALGPHRKPVYFLDNLDAFLYRETLEKIDLRKTLFLIVSKSGETLETMVLARTLLRRYQEKKIGGALEKHFAVITEEKNSPLRAMAKRNNFPFFPHPRNVPGRYSIFTAVTLIPAVLLSLDTKRFLDGISSYSKRDLQKLVQFGSVSYRRHRTSMVLFAYSERLLPFCEWATQLIAESLGKKHEGITPITAIGPKDQHSVLQLFLDGPNDKCFVFLNHGNRQDEKFFSKIVEKEQAGVMKTFKEKHRAYVTISLPGLSEKTMGALFYSFMKFTVEMASFLDVNPFSQPAVERSKHITRQLFN